MGLNFAKPVPPGGYAWWYVDALSDDGRHGLTIIAFIGSVFSPYYAWSGRSNPLNHCAINVALYGAGGHRWAMTERGQSAVDRNRDSLTIGPSSFWWNGSSLILDIDEITALFPMRINGRVRVIPEAMTEGEFSLDSRGRHRWWPIAPSARIEVCFDKLGLSWSGAGYLDTNVGDEPLEDGFINWDWSRAATKNGAAVLYDVVERSGKRNSLALSIDRTGKVETMPSPPDVALPRTLWGVPRRTQAENGEARVLRTLENAPFYARSILASRLEGEMLASVHESLTLNRLRSPIVKAMLPFRMPRIGKRAG